MNGHPPMEAGYVYAPYVPLQVTRGIKIGRMTVVESDYLAVAEFCGDIFPWEPGKMVRYHEDVFLILEVKFMNRYKRYFEIKALDQNGKIKTLETHYEIDMDSRDLEVMKL